jgi:hypothetical protein
VGWFWIGLAFTLSPCPKAAMASIQSPNQKVPEAPSLAVK